MNNLTNLLFHNWPLQKILPLLNPKWKSPHRKRVGRNAANKLPCLDLNYLKHINKYTYSILVGDFFKLSGKVKYFPCNALHFIKRQAKLS